MTSTRFIYHGSAVASGGHLTDPIVEVAEAQAAAVAPAAGGQSSARVDDYSFRDLLSYASATSVVSATESEHTGARVFSTVSTVTVEGLDIGRGVVTADRVVGRLISEQTEGSAEMPIQPVGSHFVNLRVAGVPLMARAHDPLFQGGTLDDIATACGRLAAGAASPVEPGGKLLSLAGRLAPRVPAAGGTPGSYDERTILTSLFERPAILPTGCQADGGWGIAVPGFGVVYLGELLITRFSRRLTMIRLQLGSPQKGELVVCDIGGNGSTYP